jgi:hybrid cluster-associated redox disulfide protein
MTHRRIDDPDLPLEDLMSLWPETIAVFLRHNMLCVGCLVGPFHTVMDACAEYELDVDAFYAELKDSITASKLTEPPTGVDRKR